MIAKSARYAAFLGLAGGFAVAVAPAAQAQIQVTGGNMAGEAAFFVPVPGAGGSGDVRLFDVGIQTLRIVTPNGTTTTSVFTPTASSFDDGGNGEVDPGDTGTLQGTLAGVAFTAQGSPIPFSGRQTVLNFTLNSFGPNIDAVSGSLISPDVPGEASLLFLPVEDVQVTTQGFNSTNGELQIGAFDAGLDDGVINLPSSFQFRDSGGTTTFPVDLVARRIKFKFEGENVFADIGTDFSIDNDDDFANGDDDFADGDDDDTDTIRFVGEVNRRFQIQSVGTRGSREFKIQGEFGAVDITLGGPFEISSDDELDEDELIDKYNIEGESTGITSLFGVNAVGFRGTARRDTRFSFEQGNSRFAGRSSGPVEFFAVAGVGKFNRDDDFIDFEYPNFDSNVGQFDICNICGTNLVTGGTILVGGNTVVVGSPIIVTNTSSSTSTTTVTNNVSNSVTVNPLNVNVFGLSGGFTSIAQTQYQILSTSNIQIVTNLQGFGVSSGEVTTNVRQRARVRLVERGGQRYYVVVRGTGSIFANADIDRDEDDDDDNNQVAEGDNDNDDNNQVAEGDNDNDDDNQVAEGDDDNDDDNQVAEGDDDDNDDDNQVAEGEDEEEVVTAYKLVGPSSRCFPGLVGLREIPANEVANFNNGNRNTIAKKSNNEATSTAQVSAETTTSVAQEEENLDSTTTAVDDQADTAVQVNAETTTSVAQDEENLNNTVTISTVEVDASAQVNTDTLTVSAESITR